MASRTLVIKTKMDNTEYNAQIRKMEDDLDTLMQELEAFNTDPIGNKEQIMQLEVEIEKTTNSLNKLKQKQEELNDNGMGNFSDAITRINNGMTDTIKKVGKWALALFSIRGAYSLISRTMATATQYNEQLSTDIDYMKYSIAQALMPVLQFCVQLVYKLLGGINAVSKALFGVDLFSSATANNFNKANANAKQLKKTLAGFDEMNVLNDDGSTGASGSVGVTPSLDMTQATNSMETFFTNVKSTWERIGQELSISLENPDLYQKAFGDWGTAVFGVTEIFWGLWEVVDGIIQSIIGVFEILVGAITGDTQLMGKGFIDFGDGVKNIFFGLIDIIGGIMDTIVGIVVGVINTLINFFQTNFIDFMYSLFGNLGARIAGVFGGIITTILGFFGELLSGAGLVVRGILKLFKGDLKGGLATIMQGIKTILLAPINALITGLNTVIKAMNKMSFEVPDWVPGIGGKEFGFNIPTIPKLALGGIVNNPGHGVNIGGAIAGERGQEAVLPLTNGEVMQQLGEAIGKYITVNLTNNTQLDGRTIARQMNKINQNRAFGSNS